MLLNKIKNYKSVVFRVEPHLRSLSMWLICDQKLILFSKTDYFRIEMFLTLIQLFRICVECIIRYTNKSFVFYSLSVFEQPMCVCVCVCVCPLHIVDFLKIIYKSCSNAVKHILLHTVIKLKTLTRYDRTITKICWLCHSFIILFYFILIRKQGIWQFINTWLSNFWYIKRMLNAFKICIWLQKWVGFF